MAADNPMDRVEQALSDRGISLADFAADLGESKQSVNNWKKRGIPGSKQLKVAMALGWTVEQLLSGVACVQEEGGSYAASSKEHNLLAAFRQLPAKQQDALMDLLDGIAWGQQKRPYTEPPFPREKAEESKETAKAPKRMQG